jgi:hypothetical protein
MDFLAVDRLIREYLIWMFSFALLPANSACAQKNHIFTESRFYASSIDYALDNLIEEQKAIYTGPLYFQYLVKMGNDGHPFYHNLQPESILYDGIVYSSVNFIYDVFLDEVIVINLDKRKIEYFFLGGHKFKKIGDVTRLPSGFYEVIYDNDAISLLAKWTKVFRASIWKEKASFFVVKEKVYPVHSKKEMLDVFADKEKEIKNFIRQHKLKFKKDKSTSFGKVVAFYSSLKK